MLHNHTMIRQLFQHYTVTTVKKDYGKFFYPIFITNIRGETNYVKFAEKTY